MEHEDTMLGQSVLWRFRFCYQNVNLRNSRGHNAWSGLDIHVSQKKVHGKVLELCVTVTCVSVLP